MKIICKRCTDEFWVNAIDLEERAYREWYCPYCGMTVDEEGEDNHSGLEQ